MEFYRFLGATTISLTNVRLIGTVHYSNDTLVLMSKVSFNLGLVYTTRQRYRCRPRYLPKIGTGPNGHGTPLTAPTPSMAMAMATAPCHVNGLIDHNVFYFLPWTTPAPLLCCVNELLRQVS